MLLAVEEHLPAPGHDCVMERENITGCRVGTGVSLLVLSEAGVPALSH